jgi:arabinogalactan endo-1,4-beta-galactosidase
MVSSITKLIAITLLLGLVALGSEAQAQVYVGSSMYFAGYLEEMCGVQYTDDGVPTDPFQSLADHGGNIVRAALHMSPFGNGYTSGGPDPDWGSPERVKATLQRAQDHGMATFLTIGYDSYADNGAARRNPYAAPPAWRGLAGDETALTDSIYAYTYRQLDELADAGVIPTFVAIGNEINWRFMEPNVAENQLAAFDAARKVRLLNAASQAVRDLAAARSADIRVAMHIFSPDNLSWWMGAHPGLDFDVMGMSFYHEWHSMGTFGSWGSMATWLRNTYGKQLMILETAQLWSSGFSDNHVNILGTGNIPSGYPNPPSTITQRSYMHDITVDLLSGGGLGTIYWGGDWVGSDCYIYPDQYGRGSSWENKAFWNFQNAVHDGMDWLSGPYSGTQVEPDVSRRELEVYPQPALDSVELARIPADATRLTIWSVDGRRLEAVTLTGSDRRTVRTARWAPGIYLFLVEHRDGRNTHTLLVKGQ